MGASTLATTTKLQQLKTESPLASLDSGIPDSCSVVAQTCILDSQQAPFAASIIGKHQLRTLLDPLEAVADLATPASKAFSQDTKQAFSRFIHGYAGATQETQRRADPDDCCLSSFLDDMDSPLTGRRLRKQTESDDHYAFFTRMPLDQNGCSDDNDRRMHCRRKRLWPSRSAFHRSSSQQNSQQSFSTEDSHKSSGAQRKSVSQSPHRRVSAGSDGAATALKAEMRTREACESLRFLVFGTPVTDGKRSKGGLPDYEKCGTREEVIQLHKVWKLMDEDGSGDVEFQEFLSFFSRSKADRLLGMRCVNYLVGKAKCEGLDEQEAGCTIEDMMKLIWLKATEDDVESMKHWFREAEVLMERVQTPPLLSKRKRRQIMDNFPSIDWEKRKCIHWQDLLGASLVEEGVMKDLRERCDKQDVEYVTKEDLLEILCPNGYRAHPGANICADKQGEPLVRLTNEFFTGWVYASSEADSHAGLQPFEENGGN